METKKPLAIEELLTLEELTERLKIRAGWVYQHIHSQSLPFPHTRIGRYLRFPVSGVSKYLESQTKVSA
jgi:excisionase family DNA binding protein